MKRYLKALILAGALATTLAPAAMASQAPARQQVETVSSSVRPCAGYLEITATADAPMRFYIYSITGQLVKSIDVLGTVQVELPHGYYIVKCSEWSKQVIVK